MTIKTTLDYARWYISKGLSVIPLNKGYGDKRDKQPKAYLLPEETVIVNGKEEKHHTWTPYQKRRPTDEELVRWFKDDKSNIAISTGAISGVVVVDLDSKEAVEFYNQTNPSPTLMVKTGKGYHLYFKHKDGVTNFQKRDDLPGVDLRGEGGYCVAPPSIHPSGKQYEWIEGRGLDDVPLADLPDWILAKGSQDKTPLKELYRGVEEGNRNDSLARLVGSWVNDGLSFSECLENASLWNDKNSPPLPDREIETTVKSIFEKHHKEKDRLTEWQEEIFANIVKKLKALPNDLEPEKKVDIFYKEFLHEVKNLSSIELAQVAPLVKEKLGVGIHDLKKEIKNILFSTSSRGASLSSLMSLSSLKPPVGFIEVIKTKDGLKYWLSSGEVKNSLEIEGVRYELPQQVDLVSLPTERVFNFIHESNASLFDEVERFIYDHLDLQEDFGYKVLALWVFHTWLLDKFNASPIIHFLGPYASGKSRGGDVLGALAKRSLSTVNLTGAPIFRVTALYEPTFIIDEVKLTGRDKNRDILELLNARFQRGRKVIRVDPDKKGLDSILDFDVFGPTVLCGLDELPSTPKSRAIVFIMEQNVRPVREHLDSKRAEILRDRLCAFRARHVVNEMPRVRRFVKDGRLWDAVGPLNQILKLVAPELEEDFIAFFETIEKERQDETFDSFDAEIVNALLKCSDKVEQGKILISHIVEEFNEGRSEREKITSGTIGKVLTRLGLKKARTTGGVRARFWNEKKIERLCRRFGIDQVTLGTLESDNKDEQKARLNHNNDIRDDSDIKMKGTENKKLNTKEEGVFI